MYLFIELFLKTAFKINENSSIIECLKNERKFYLHNIKKSKVCKNNEYST